MKLIKVGSVPSENLEISIDTQLGNSLGIGNNQNITLCYGKRKVSVTVLIHDMDESEKINVSKKIVDLLLIDTKANYEIMFDNNQLILGPIIGLLLGKTEKRLIKNLKHFTIYTMLHHQVNGLLFVFCEEQIDVKEEQITGYLFDPDEPGHWRRAVLPLPGAIFRRVELSKRILAFLEDKMGRSFFNSTYFDKWQFWKWLSPYQEIRESLPETSNIVKLESVNEFIGKYDGVYLKPKNGSRGKGIHFIRKIDNQYEVTKNYQDEIKYLSESDMTQFLAKHSYYLIQQPIQLQPFENRKVDYRVIIQKNETGYWQCTGIIARFGKANAVTSNFKAKGFAKEGIEALKIQFGYDQLKAFQKYQEIVRVCIKMAKVVDELGGGYADLGVDIGIDDQEKIWVIEMNKRPDHDFPLMIKDRKMYYSVKSNPILYAKYVAMNNNSKKGFNHHDG